jgi:hypothetical protein
MDLKQTTSIYLNKLIEPVRNKLKTSKTAEKLAKEIKSFKVTK